MKTIVNDKVKLKLLIGQISNDVDFMDNDNFGTKNSFKRIFCEFMLENIFYRKDSKCKSYKPQIGDKIEAKKIPVYSFRYKIAFNKSEEKEYSKRITKEHVKS